MSKLDALIQKLCPHGTEYFYLGELEDAKKITLGRGKVISKKDITDNPGSYPVYSSSAVGDGEIGRYGKFMFEDVRLSWSVDGGGKFFYRDAPRYSITNVSGWLKVNEDTSVNIKYLYYALLNEWSKKFFDYTHKAHPSVVRKEYRIPLPPLPVQQEIVRILDNFTELTAELNKKLDEELAARRKQYEHYRDELLTFGDEVPKVHLRELFNTQNGYTPSKAKPEFWSNGTIPWFRMEDIRENGRILDQAIQTVSLKAIKGKPFPVNSIIVATSATIGEHALITVESLANQRFTYLMLKDEYKERVNIKFLFYYCFLLDEYCLSCLNQGNFASVDMVKFGKFLFAIPPIEKQNYIVDQLDRFNTLCNDLTSSLPAEIAARQKQYEYYRDKLLTFQEKKGE